MPGELLQVVEGPSAGATLALDDDLELGRAAGVEGRLGEDPELSRHHARITRGPDGRVVVYDLGSTNGTFVNGRRIEAAEALAPGDEVMVGQTKLQFVAETAPPPPEPAAAPPPSPPPEPAATPAPTQATPPQPSAQPQAPPATGVPIRSASALRQGSIVRAGLPATMKGRIFPSIGLLLVQIVLGYEWLISGITKAVRGGFPSGLEEELEEETLDAANWYHHFTDDFILPNAELVGWLTMIIEIVLGVVLIAAALLWMFRWERLPRPARSAVLLSTAIACAIGIILNMQFYLASDDRVPFFLAEEAFDEGVGLDVLMPFLELIVGLVAWWTWLSLRQGRRASTA